MFPVVHVSKSGCSPSDIAKWFSSLFPQSPALKEAFGSCLTWNLFYDVGMKSLDLTRREGGSFFNDLILHEIASLLQAGSDTKLQVFAVLVPPGALSFLPPHLVASPGSCEALQKITCTHEEALPNCFMLLSWTEKAHKYELQWGRKIRATVSSRKYFKE